jgi:integrase
MESLPLLDCAGRRRSPATTSSFHQGLPPRNKGRRYPPDPATVEEIIAVMRAAGDGPKGVRLRAVIVMLWRGGLRISEALSLNETDLDPTAGRCWCATARVKSSARSEWTAGRGSRGLDCVGPCRLVRCSA